jgi:hypothetical protein
MSNPEDFLQRWSRRKHDAADRRKPSAAAEATEEPAPAIPEAATQDASDPPLDLASLPPIETIGAGSDIRAFLAKGVPEDMKRAALRRAWASDPAIRDFIGLSENSWDFNASEAVPGFGPLDGDSIQRLLGRVMGEPEADQAKGCRNEAPDVRSQSAAVAAAQEESPDAGDSASAERDIEISQDDRIAIGSQNELATRPKEKNSPPSRRRHGGALPK